MIGAQGWRALALARPSVPAFNRKSEMEFEPVKVTVPAPSFVSVPPVMDVLIVGSATVDVSDTALATRVNAPPLML